MAKSLREASKAAKISQLDSFGTSKGEFTIENQLTAIELVIGDFIKRIHENLQQEDMIVSGKIKDIVVEKNGNTIEVLANEELIYQDKGVNGSKVKKYNTPFSYKNKKPPVQPFIEWIKKKNITLRNNAKYKGKESEFKHLTKEQEIESAAYAIREKVFQEGVKPRNVYSKEIPKLIEDCGKELGELIVKEILRKL